MKYLKYFFLGLFFYSNSLYAFTNSEFPSNARSRLGRDVNYGKNLENIPLTDKTDSLNLLNPADLIISFKPQLVADKKKIKNYIEYLLNGFMHMAIVVSPDSKEMCKLEIPQNFKCGPEIYKEIHNDRFHIIMRLKDEFRRPGLAESVENSSLRISGFEKKGGKLLKIRIVKSDPLLRFYEQKNSEDLPDKLYCSLIPYLAYKQNGILISKPASIFELLSAKGGLPEYSGMKQIIEHYSDGSFLLKLLYNFFYVWERFAISESLKPTKIFFSKIIYPKFAFESMYLRPILIVPPEFSETKE